MKEKDLYKIQQKKGFYGLRSIYTHTYTHALATTAKKLLNPK